MSDPVNLERQDFPVGDNWRSFGQAVQITRQPEFYFAWNDFESITVSTTAIGLSNGPVSRNNKCTITVETATVAFRIDDLPPTATVGHILNAGDMLELESREEMNKIKFIRVNSADATLRVSYASRVRK